MNAVRLLLLSVVCLGVPRVTIAQAADSERCELPQPRVLRAEANAIVQVWELPADPIWTSDELPEAPGYAAYRTRIRAVGGDQPQPVADPPTIRDDNERELWRKEDLNTDRMYNGVGEVRPVRCIDAALFALQDARYSQLTHPTEFVAHILRSDGRLKIYFGASDEPTPPKSVYGLDEVAAAVAEGW